MAILIKNGAGIRPLKKVRKFPGMQGIILTNCLVMALLNTQMLSDIIKMHCIIYEGPGSQLGGAPLKSVISKI